VQAATAANTSRSARRRRQHLQRRDAESDEPAEKAVCAFCLAEFEESESMRVLPHCGHAASRLKQTTGGEVRVAGAEVPVAGVPGGGGSRASRDLRFVSCLRGLTHNPSQPAS
jgi:hypothetical protein